MSLTEKKAIEINEKSFHEMRSTQNLDPNPELRYVIAEKLIEKGIVLVDKTLDNFEELKAALEKAAAEWNKRNADQFIEAAIAVLPKKEKVSLLLSAFGFLAENKNKQTGLKPTITDQSKIDSGLDSKPTKSNNKPII